MSQESIKMTMREVMDNQQDLIERLIKQQSKVKKEPKDRRTRARQDTLEATRESLWLSIRKNHEILRKSHPQPPEEYFIKFEEAAAISESIKSKLSSWVLVERGSQGRKSDSEVKSVDKLEEEPRPDDENDDSLSASKISDKEPMPDDVNNDFASASKASGNGYYEPAGKRRSKSTTCKPCTKTGATKHSKHRSTSSESSFSSSGYDEAKAKKGGRMNSDKPYKVKGKDHKASEHSKHRSRSSESSYSSSGYNEATAKKGGRMNSDKPYKAKGKDYKASEHSKHRSRSSESSYSSSGYNEVTAKKGGRMNSDKPYKAKGEYHEAEKSKGEIKSSKRQKSKKTYYYSDSESESDVPKSSRKRSSKKESKMYFSESDSSVEEVPVSAKKKWSQMVEEEEKSKRSKQRPYYVMYDDQQAKIKPLEINIPDFDGDFKRYRAFKRSFSDIIKRTKYGNGDLLRYLQSKLKGEAYELIAYLPDSSKSYAKAWKILDRTYNNKRLQLEETVHLIFDPKCSTKPRDAQSHFEYKNRIQAILTSYDALKAEPHDILMVLVLSRMDPATKSRFEDYLGKSTTTPSFKNLFGFFDKEHSVLINQKFTMHSPLSQHEDTTPKDSNQKGSSGNRDNKQKVKTFSTQSSENKVPSCFICNKTHRIVDCDIFLSSNNRQALMKEHKICLYCAKHKYDRNSKCRSYKYLKCDKCEGKHITLLHPLEESTVLHLNSNTDDHHTYSILPTAVATFLDGRGNAVELRCLIDLCAERSYVSENVAQKLNLKLTKANLKICGVSNLQGRARSTAKLIMVLGAVGQPNIEAEAIVVPKVTGEIPQVNIGSQLTQGYKLADPLFYKPGGVGILLGVDIAARLFKEDEPMKILDDGKLVLQPTYLGYIIAGRSGRTSNFVSAFVTYNESIHQVNQDEDLTKRILEFYEIPEEEEDTYQDTREYCEALFKEKHIRQEDGRYVVPVPWKVDAPQLGHSYRKAVQLFLSQERKWSKDSEHYSLSNEFMAKYKNLNHMTEILDECDIKNDSSDVYYIPYHSVLRKQALTTKLRNVFNASMPTSNQISLNHTMHEGPKLQTSIKDIIITARSFPVIYSADVSMMFRQILILPEDRDKHRIIWRPSKDEQLCEYRLNTITYGTDAAPFMAIRTMHQCAEDNATPGIANIIKKAFYMDDLLYGADTVDEARLQIQQINNALSAGHLPLTKWMSNDDDVLTDIPVENKISHYVSSNNTQVKVLGLLYDFDDDKFVLNFKKPDTIKFTKRGISSVAASFYDPLGFVLPFIMALRIFLQEIWKERVEWDEKVKEDLQSRFKKLLNGVENLNSIAIPRHISCDEDSTMDIIGFADASGRGQAAVIYSRVKLISGYKISLMTARGNVSKLKTKAILESNQCTIPKLELEALVTLSSLYADIQKSLAHRKLKFTSYTDSQVALAWVRSKAPNTNKFVDRRVKKIKSTIEPGRLHYVKSEENPADPASRGLSAEQLSSCASWFLGPSWLQLEDLPQTPYPEDAEPICNEFTNTLATRMYQIEESMFDHISNYEKTVRITAYCLRWRHPSKSTVVNAEEVKRAKERLISYYQQLHFGHVIEDVRKGKSTPKGHWLRSLTPFLDDNNLLRVGGRLGNAINLTNSQRHPIIIPKSHFRKLLIEHTHTANFHASNSLMLRLLIEDYWIAGIKQVIQSVVRKCTRCIRWRAKSVQPVMSQLPAERVTPSDTFENIGVDLSGPYIIKASPLRFDKKMKVWVVHFVCMATKAAHLEIVSDLSTEGFLASFSRFCSRRGTSKQVYSDNGTNFVGANRLLKETWLKILKRTEEKTAMQEISWRFIPRHSPSFGGLWEASVKAMKYFVKRMMGTQNLTYEEFHTLLCKIEALLNSRPLFANPLNANEDPALTPFHFINQRGLKPSAIESYNKTPITKKWLNINQIQQQFWERFRVEYLRELQAKVKWQVPQRNLEVNDVVIIKEPSTSPGDWKLGKITNTYPDPTGVIRKVDVATAYKESKVHAVNQLVPLLHPTSEDIAELNENTENDKSTNNNPNDDYDDHTNQNNEVQNNPDPIIRRISPRLSKISLVHLCLMVLVIGMPTASCKPIDRLSEGINIRYLNRVHEKAFDIQFAIKTSLNLTHDTSVIQNTLLDFTDECRKLSVGKASIKEICKSLNLSIDKLAQQTIEEINGGYITKVKRWLGITSKGIWKAAPAIATSLGMIYQESRINDLQKQLKDTKLKMQKTVNVLLNTTDIEYTNVEHKLNEVIQKQEEVLVTETITNYAQNIELLFNSIKSQHVDVILITPMAEFTEFVQPILAKLKGIAVPPIGDDIFRIHPPVKSIQNDNTIVTFTVPMVNEKKFNHWAVISVPNSEGKTILLSNEDIYQRVIVNEFNTSYSDVTEIKFHHPSIIDSITFSAMSTCLSNIFSSAKFVEGCTTTSVSTDEDKMAPLLPYLVVVFASKTSQIAANCSDAQIERITEAAIINSSECNIVGRGITSNVARPIQLHEKPLNSINNDDIKPNVNPSVQPLYREQLIKDARESLRNDWETVLRYPDTGITIAILLAIASIMIVIIITVKGCCKQSQHSARWFPEWEGTLHPVNHQI